jgi:hypothetical protein
MKQIKENPIILKIKEINENLNGKLKQHLKHKNNTYLYYV